MKQQRNPYFGSMTLALLVSSVTFSISAGACPDLSGHFKCELPGSDSGKTYDVAVTQSVVDGITTYEFQSPKAALTRTIIADSATRKNEYVHREQKTTIYSRYFCKDDKKLLADLTQVFVEYPSAPEELSSGTQEISLNSSGDLEKSTYDNETKWTQTEVCEHASP